MNVMNKNIINSIFFAFCVSKAAAQNQVVTRDPVAYYRSAYDFKSGDKMFKLEADLNQDGRQDILLSNTVHAEDGYEDANYVPWEIFLLREDGNYASVGEKTDSGVNYGVLAAFPKNRYWIRQIPEINRYGLLYLSCGRGGHAKCGLQAIVIEGESFKKIPIGEPVDAETGYDQLAPRVPIPPTPVIQEFNP